MEYVDMIKDAQKRGLATENKMWKSISALGDGLTILKQTNPKEYWKIMRKQHEIIFNGHYSEEFAKHDVEHLHYTDSNGAKQTGAHWTLSQIASATQGKSFPNGVNECDKFVAYNATYADLCRKFDDSQILDAAYLFWFGDEDWHEGEECTKIWDYMTLAWN